MNRNNTSEKGIRFEDTQWLSALRLFVMFVVLFCHFEYQAYEYAYGTNLEIVWLSEDSPLQFWLYGIYGKYFFAMMCLVSGAVAALQTVNGKAGKPVQYAVKRYIRLQLPVFAMSFVYIATDLLTYRRYTASMILKGMFVLGDCSLDDHLWALIDFYIGSFVVYLIYYFLPKRKILRILLMLAIAAGGFVWLGGNTSNYLWIFPTVLGGVLYEILDFIAVREQDIPAKFAWLLLLIPVMILRRGHESFIMYWRNTACMLVVVPLMRLTGFHRLLNKLYSTKTVHEWGAMSFSIFCIHGWINTYIVATLMRLYGNELSEHLAFPYIIGFMTLLVLTFWASRIMYQYVERDLYRKISAKITQYITF